MEQKKILILVTKISETKNRFYDAIAAKVSQNTKVDLAVFSDIGVVIDGEKTSVFVGDKDIKNYNLIYIRRSGEEYKKLASIVALYCHSKGVKCLDSANREAGTFSNKLYSLLKLHNEGFPVIPTVMVNRKKVLQEADGLVARFGLPMVAKDTHSQRGKGVFLIKEKDDFQTILDKVSDNQLMFQKFIEKKREYRVLVLRNKIGCFEEKVADPGEFRNNVSLGAAELFLDTDSIPTTLKDLAINSAGVLGIEIAGVDIIESTDGSDYILEVNRGPGLTYDSSESPETANIAKFLEEEAQ